MLRRIFGSTIDVRRGEVLLTLLMFFYYYLLLVTYYFLKPARDSLFLVKLGSDQLPIVFMLTGIIVVPVITIYSRASKNLKLNQLINITTGVVIANLLVLRWLLEFDSPWVPYVFYIWVSIYGVLVTSQFWLFANAIFDATQAKRIFVLLGLGGIIGAFTGGQVMSFFVETLNISIHNLLFFCMVFLGICIVLSTVIWRIHQRGGATAPAPAVGRRKTEKRESYMEMFRTIKRSRHLLLIVGIIAMTMATASFVDYQFKAMAKASFESGKDLGAFLGKFYGWMSLISFAFQLLISYRFLRWFGVGGAITLLPLGLIAGSITMMAMPGLAAAVILRGADGVFKYSIDKTGRELLFLPVPLDIKKRTKVFIDIFVDRWFRGFSGAVLLLFVAVLHFSVRQISFVVVGIIAIWLVLVFIMRKEYVNAFRQALERREIDVNDLRINIAEASTLEALKAALNSDNERQIVYALKMLQEVRDDAVLDAVRPLLNHDSREVRALAVKTLHVSEDPALISLMRDRLSDPDPAVRRDAMHYLCIHENGNEVACFERYLNDGDVRLRVAALGCIAEYGAVETRDLVHDDMIRGLIAREGSGGEFARLQVAETIGKVRRREFSPYLVQLLDDPCETVVNAAMGSIGQMADRELLPHLVERLHDSRLRRGAREGLARFGDRISGTLSDHIIDQSMNVSTRSNLCRVLSLIPTQHSVDTLIALLDQVESEMRYHVIKALNTLRARHPELKFRHDALNGALIDETESYYNILQIAKVTGEPTGAAGQLLKRALRERIGKNVELMFRLLSLHYAQKDIHGAYLGIIGGKKQLRASAIEFLDNILKKEVKRYMFPIVDSITEDAKIRKGQELFGVSMSDCKSGIRCLLKGNDPWLKACAIFTLRNGVPPDLAALVNDCREDCNPVVREAACLVTAE